MKRETPASQADKDVPRTSRAPWLRYGGNALSLLGVDSASRAATFVLYALVARYRGTTEFGLMSLALALSYAFQVVAVAGLRTLITREVARDRRQTGAYATAGAFVVVGASALAMAALWAFVARAGYASDTSTVILLVAASLPLYALTTVCDAIFQGWERMHFSTLAQLPVQALKIGAGAYLLSHGYGLRALGFVLIIAQATMLAVECWLLCRYVVWPLPRVTRAYAVGLVRAGSTFLGIDALIAVMGSGNVVLLSMWVSERDVGLFSAANQLLVPIALVFQNVVLSVFPVMCRRGAVGDRALRHFADGLLAALLALAVPAVIGLLFLAGPGLILVYGRPEFGSAAAPLQIMAGTLLLLPLTNVLGQVLVATGREGTTFRIVAVDVAVSLVSGALLISTFGLLGAALSALLTRVVDFLLHYRATGRLLAGIPLHQRGWMPAAAGLALTVSLLVTVHAPLFGRIVAGVVTYAVAMLLLVARAAGGPQGLKARYQQLVSDEGA